MQKMDTNEVKPVEQTTEKRKGQFGGSQPNRSKPGPYPSRRTLLIQACEDGSLREADYLAAIKELTQHDSLHTNPISLKETLRLLHKAVKPDAKTGKRYVTGTHLRSALDLISRVNEKVEAAKRPVVSAPVSNQPSAEPVNPAETRPEVSEKVEPEPVLDLEPVLDTPSVQQEPDQQVSEPEAIPPSESERGELRRMLSMVHDGYVPNFPGEQRIVKSVPVLSAMAAFAKTRQIQFEETGHTSMGAVEGNVVIRSSVLEPRIFAKVRRAYFATWARSGFKEESLPPEMREGYKAMLHSLEFVTTVSSQSSVPEIEISDRSAKPEVVYPRYRVRKWGTKEDDAKKQGPRDPNIGGGCELAESYARAAREPGFDL
jgi:hypothetical protein